MSFGTLSLSVIVLWLAIYALHRIFDSSNDHSNLPLPASAAASTSARYRAEESSTRVILDKLHLRVETNAFNKMHSRCISRFTGTGINKGSGARGKKVLTLFYDAGSALGALGMIGALCIVLWTSGNLLGTLVAWFNASQPVEVGHSKRGLDVAGDLNSRNEASGPLLKPIIPGVTVPLSHFPIIFVAVLACQIIHEAGHALAASLEAIPLVVTGLSLSLVFPSAYVSFPNLATDNLKKQPRQRMRIVAGGAWHNLVLYVICLAAGAAGIGGLWGWIGYEDTKATGRVVLGLDGDSSLRGYLPVGAVVTQLDDTSLAPEANREDMWESYLSGSRLYEAESEGWCVQESWWMDKAETCCSRSATNPAHALPPTPYVGSCFIADDTIPDARMRCLDPVPLLTGRHQEQNDRHSEHAEERRRCSAVNTCGRTSVCVHPRAGEQLLRVYFRVYDGDVQVLLWNGPRREVWEQVEVGTWKPRGRLWFLPLGLPEIAGVFFEYVKMVTLSLYFFNLLPLPFLDGTQMLEAMLDFAGGSNANDSYHSSDDVFGDELDALEGGAIGESGRGGGRPRSAWMRSWRARLEKAVKSGTTMLIGVCIALGIINWMVVR
ncbi:hypothetical protein FIBSPDRAFT_1039738 [Athelia psychrophila]|uniref:Endopeptidase S2P n=1 Tax=Athelia psychrophila TaxID=1759441 RepID=A0A166R8I8_9AGAM|nr:hypothetical protein FIBSPDRAFT_1039738 [Fibularhizoctonia sp. CBS 109695]